MGNGRPPPTKGHFFSSLQLGRPVGSSFTVIIFIGGEPYESGEWEPVTSSDEELPVADHQPSLTTTASSTSNTASSTTSSVTTQLSTSSSAARVVESSSASAHTSESLLLDSVNNNSNENFTLVMSGLPGNNIMFGTIDNSSDDNDGNLNDNVGNIDDNDTSNSIISDVQGDNISSDVNMNINNLEGDNIVVDDLESSNINTSLTRSNNNDSVNINMSNVGNIVAHTGDHDSISVNSLANSHLTAHNNQGNEECGDYVMPGFDRVSDSPAKNIVNSSNILSGSVLSSGS